ncbi:sulfate ABC transporter permease subunit CysT [Microlunatus elymi]|uniref:Sulfate transport system permease protein CysT n=1 Tax=Microlunatus elymi TaxID=2596828 RepID=A0A516Q4U8_9ACTN|nr:sulfate ABC transporter permease subunit CysT [Microlunatus elymi]QDP98459.1 sulfate ABC transporter permease subunit CysT [Microlunatus elymi]
MDTRPAKAVPASGIVGRRRAPTGQRLALTRASGIGLGIAMVWFSLLVLIPLIAVVVQASAAGWAGFARTLANPQTASAVLFTIWVSVLVTLIDVVVGTAVAWVLVRDDFPGKRLLEIAIDVPFALPTIVAGLALIAIYGPTSAVNISNTRVGVLVALLFVTLPFVVRTVEPVLKELEPEVEEAAQSLGAGRFTVFRRILLPTLAPAVASGAALSFARGVSEYGSLVLVSGNLPFHTEVASVRIIAYIEGDQRTNAAAVAAILLVVALIAIVSLDLIARRVARYDQ